HRARFAALPAGAARESRGADPHRRRRGGTRSRRAARRPGHALGRVRARAAPARLLEGLARLLAPDGAIYIQTTNEESLAPSRGRLSYRLTPGRLTRIVRRTHEPHHVVFFTRTGLRGMAERADLDITQLWFDRLAHARMDGNPNRHPGDGDGP